jgi:hypothetical protein
VGLVFPRSSIANKSLALSNSVGVIDSGYRGEVMAKFKVTLHPHDMHSYDIGDRIAQLIVIPALDIEFEEVEELSDSDRGIAILIDERFTYSKYLSLMPPHWTNKKCITNIFDLKNEIKDFYKKS